MAKEIGVSRQDAANPRYVRMRQEILDIARKNPYNRSLIIVGAHDNSLQYFEERTSLLKRSCLSRCLESECMCQTTLWYLFQRWHS